MTTAYTLYLGKCDAIRKDTLRAIKKFKPFSIVQCALGVVTIIFGIASIAVATNNPGFPIFNFGPLMTGCFELVTGLCLLFTVRVEVKDTSRPKLNFMMKVHFCLSLLVQVVSAVSLIIAFMAFSVCLKIEEEYFYYNYAGYRKVHDVEQFCHPNRDAKIAMSFFTGVTCMLVFLWNSYGFCFYCSYGMLFGMGWKGTL